MTDLSSAIDDDTHVAISVAGYQQACGELEQWEDVRVEETTVDPEPGP